MPRCFRHARRSLQCDVHYDASTCIANASRAPSYVNELGSVPVTFATKAVILADFPLPAGSLHATEVVDIQLVVVHCVAPVHAIGDESSGPRFVPDIVSVEPPVVGPFPGLPVVSRGAARHQSAICTTSH